jgi:hypothetical protein
MSGRHGAGPTARKARRGTAALLGGATVLGLWFGLRAPDVSPVAVPAPAAEAQAAQAAQAAPVAPVFPPQGAPGARRAGGGR